MKFWEKVMDIAWIRRHWHCRQILEMLGKIEQLQNENTALAAERDFYKEQTSELLTKLKSTLNLHFESLR
jgi:hypothetical protein